MSNDIPPSVRRLLCYAHVHGGRTEGGRLSDKRGNLTNLPSAPKNQNGKGLSGLKEIMFGGHLRSPFNKGTDSVRTGNT